MTLKYIISHIGRSWCLNDRLDFSNHTCSSKSNTRVSATIPEQHMRTPIGTNKGPTEIRKQPAQMLSSTKVGQAQTPDLKLFNMPRHPTQYSSFNQETNHQTQLPGPKEPVWMWFKTPREKIPKILSLMRPYTMNVLLASATDLQTGRENQPITGWETRMWQGQTRITRRADPVEILALLWLGQ